MNSAGTALFLFVSILPAFVRVSYGSSLEDLMPNGFPNQEKPASFRQFSGFLDISPAKHIHYVYVESQNSPATDPVVFWTNGGKSVDIYEIYCRMKCFDLM